MATDAPPSDPVTVLEARLRPLLDEVRAAVADPLFGPGRDAVRRFLADAPVGPCVRLYAAYQSAAAAAEPVPAMLDRLSPENRFVLDLVTAIYSVPDPADAPSAFPDYRQLAEME